MKLKNLSPNPQSRSARFVVVHAIWYCCCLVVLMNVGPWWCKAKPILIYQGVHCCTNVCYLHLDIILSSQVFSLHIKSVIHGGCKLLCSNGHLDRSRCLDISHIKLNTLNRMWLAWMKGYLTNLCTIYWPIVAKLFWLKPICLQT